MALQSSGAISLSQLQGEYGGSNPISMSEYYRNGGLVPNAITSSSTAPGAYTAYQYNQATYFWRVGISAEGWWAGSSASSPQFLATTATSFSAGGYDYQRGSFVGNVTTGSGKSAFTWAYYRIRRRQSSVTTTTSTPVNQSVPTSGQISLSQFYGGRKT